MDLKILLDEESKEIINNKLSTLIETMNTEIENISQIIENVNQVIENPEIFNIINKIIVTQDNLSIEKDNFIEYRDKVDKNWEEIIEIDEQLGTIYEEVIASE